MTNVIEHSEMSSKIREYFKLWDNTKKPIRTQTVDVAEMVDEEYVWEKIESVHQHWHEVYFRQDFSSQDDKELELDSCRYASEFWTKVAELKRMEL